MKVSAPLPPPPTPAPVAPAEPSVSGIVSPPKIAEWPAWHRGSDKFLYSLLLLTACLAGMFVARNSDIWRHFAVGRLLVKGNYTPGSDPLSFTGEARAWVNQNLLFEPLAYALYSADRTGTAIVAVKALTFAGVFVLLFQLRRRETSLWPWCLFAGLGILACAPQATLRPQVFGMFCLASAPLLLFRGDWISKRWRTPLLFGGLTAVWGMLDASAFLGPLLILLSLIGELLLKPDSEGEKNVLAPPPVASLVRTLPLALAGWLLNPSVLLALVKSPGDALGQLIPAELFFGYRPLVLGDPELEQTLSLSAFSSDFSKSEAFGYNANGLGALVLLALSGVLLMLRFRMSHVLLWVGFAYLPVAHYRWIPFFAILAVPLAAAYACHFGSYLRLSTVDDQRSKLFILSAGIARIFSLFAASAMLLAAFPGWLHPKTNSDLAFARRVDWGIESDAGARRTAELIERWRTRGELPSDVKLLLAYPDYGDYSSWFAPQDKVFADTRYQFHRAELPDLVAIREVLRVTPSEKEAPKAELLALAKKYNAGGIVICRANTSIDNGIVARAALGFGPARSLNELFARVWMVNGRSAIVGRDDTEPYSGITKHLSFDAKLAAFGPQASEAPNGSPRAAEVQAEGIVARFLARPLTVPSETDDALMFRDRAALETQDADGPWLQASQLGSGALAGGFNLLATGQLNPNRRPPSDNELAYEVLALRAARAGAAKNPDQALTHRAMASAFQLRYISQAQLREGTLLPLTGFVRAMARYPEPDRPRDRFSRSAIMDGLQLFILQLKLQQYDCALQTINAVLVRMENAQPGDLPPPTFFPEFGRNFLQVTGAQLPPLLAPGEKPDSIAGKGPDWVKKKYEDVRDETKKLFAQRNEAFTSRLKSSQPGNQDPFGAGKLTLAEQFLFACELGLPQKALDLVPENLADVPQTEFAVRIKAGLNPQFVQGFVSRYRYLLTPFTFQRPAIDVDLRLQTVSLLFQLGKVEQASEVLKSLDTWVEEHSNKHSDDKNGPFWRDSIGGLQAEQAWIVGDYTRSAEYLRQRIRELPKIDPKDSARAVEILTGRGPIATEATGALIGTPAMVELAVNVNRSVGLLQNLRSEAHYFYEQGLYALLAGNMPLARDAFAQSLKPQGVPIEKLGVPRDDLERMFSERYLKLLEHYSEKRP